MVAVLSKIEADLTEYITDLDTLGHNINTLASSKRLAAQRSEHDTTAGGAQRVASEEVRTMVDRCRNYAKKIQACLHDLKELKKKLKGTEGEDVFPNRFGGGTVDHDYSYKTSWCTSTVARRLFVQELWIIKSFC